MRGFGQPFEPSKRSESNILHLRMIQHQQQRINAARHTARSLQFACHFGNAAYSILCRHRFHNRASHGVCNAEEGPPQFRTAQGDAEPIPRRTTDRPWRRILFPLKQAHQQEDDDVIRYGKMIVCTYGRRPAVPRSFAHAVAMHGPHHSCPKSVPWRNAAVYPVVLVRFRDCATIRSLRCAKLCRLSNVRVGFIYCLTTYPINSPWNISSFYISSPATASGEIRRRNRQGLK
jgi:hypothetical protein